MNFWNTISNIGVQNANDYYTRRRIILLNQFAVVAGTIYLLSGLNNLFVVKEVFSAIFLFCLTNLILLILWFNKKAKVHISTIYLFSLVLFSIFYFDSYSGFKSGSYLFYFPLTFAIAFLFDYKTEIRKVLLYTGLIVLAVIINMITDYKLFESENINDDIRITKFFFNLPISLIAVSYFVYLHLLTSKEQHELLSLQLVQKQQSEAFINKSLKEKELLLSELHHRVKNNLAIISSLLNFGIQNNSSSETALIESKNRVQSMALIHNLLYRNSDLSSISFSLYIDALVDEINSSYPIKNDKKIIIEKIITDVELDINKAIPCGLLINELLTNAYKHAFTANTLNPTITIKFSNESLSYYLEIKDNGIGLPENYATKKTCGIEIIESLCDQLEARHSFSSKNGVSFKAWFN